jgi:hypothetical protein
MIISDDFINIYDLQEAVARVINRMPEFIGLRSINSSEEVPVSLIKIAYEAVREERETRKENNKAIDRYFSFGEVK